MPTSTDRDLYEVLGVDRSADQKEIKRAFLKKARVLHPDVSDDPDAEAKFKELNEAYSILSDEQRRANYDRFGDPDGPGGPGFDMGDIFGGGFSGGFSMADLFSEFFGGGMGGAAATGRARPVRQRGRDMSITMTISLQQAATGLERTITYDRLAPCDDCEGTGAEGDAEVETCPMCHGTGVVTSIQQTILGTMQTQTTCPECGGTGTVVTHPCETCNGQGRTPAKETVTVSIPAGIFDGDTIIIHGMGEAGVNGAPAGDLLVHISITQDPRFVRNGEDLVTPLKVDAFEAMVGATLSLDGVMPDEVVLVDVPAGTQQGTPIVVDGYGMPYQGTDGRGNLVAVVDVTVPELDEHQQREVARIAKEFGSRVKGGAHFARRGHEEEIPPVPEPPKARADKKAKRKKRRARKKK